MNRRKRLWVSVACLVVVVSIAGAVGWTMIDNEEPPREISVEEAAGILDRAVTYATSGDLDKLCDLGGSVSMCQSKWQDAGGWEAVPPQSPDIVETYLIPTKDLGSGSQSTGGRVLVLEGVDGLGRPYRTEFLVFDAGSHGLAVINVVYWSGIGIAQTDDEGRGTAEPLPTS